MLVKYPGLTLAGGFGIAVAIAIGGGYFSLSQSIIYPTIPLSEGDRLVGLENWNVERSTEDPRALHDFVLWREEMQSVDDMAAFQTVTRNVVVVDGSAQPMEVAEITPSGFRLARTPPLLGRILLEGDAARDATPVIVIGFDMWRARFASDPDIVGRDLRLGSTVHTVVGVMPEGFAFPLDHGAWTPLKADPSDYPRGEGPAIFISGRLAPGFDLADAQAELTVIGDRMAATFPDTHGPLRAQVLPYHYPLAVPRRLLRGIFGQALRQISVGVALVVVAALLIDGAVEGTLLRGYGGAFLSVMVMIMTVVGLFAALGPARRGLRIEPTEALKAE